jgi:hypothetical protein
MSKIMASRPVIIHGRMGSNVFRLHDDRRALNCRLFTVTDGVAGKPTFGIMFSSCNSFKLAMFAFAVRFVAKGCSFLFHDFDQEYVCRQLRTLTHGGGGHDSEYESIIF